MANGLQTPAKIRNLQRKLYLKAKEEPTFRFYLLYDKVHRWDVLTHAYRLAKANKGAPGVDGMTFEQIETSGAEGWLERLQEELQSKTYRPQPVRRVWIPKPNGGERPLGIPTIRDRVVQTAAKLVVEPIFESDFEPNTYGYRPQRSAGQAIQQVHHHLVAGHKDVVDADLSKYFDTIPHADLMKSVARRIVDKHMLRLIKSWLKVPVHEERGDGGPTVTGGKNTQRGTPQGGVISPLLANLYMNRFLKYWRLQGWDRRLQAHIVSYADDFVILSQGHAREALEVARRALTRMGLTLNDDKTRVCNAKSERFSFLGYEFGPHCHKRNGRWYTGASPSKKSVKRIKDQITTVLRPSNVQPWPEIRGQLVPMLRGWCGYFDYGSLYKAYMAVENHLYERTRSFLRRRHKVQSRGTRRFTRETVLTETLGVRYLRLLRPSATPCASR